MPAIISHTNRIITPAVAMPNHRAIMDSVRGVCVGPPIVEAARLEARLGWIGVTFAESCAWPPFFAEADPKLLIEYRAPVTVGVNVDELIGINLDWPRRWRETREDDLLAHLTAMTERTPHPYYKAAIDFARYSIDNADWFHRPPREGALLTLRRREEF